MERLKKITATAGIVAVLSGLLGFVGYRYFFSDSGLDNYTHRLITPAHAGETIEDVQSDFSHNFATDSQPVPVFAGDTEFLDADAKIIYRYHYLKDGHLDIISEDAPYFLVGLTRAELAEKLTGWELAEFRPLLAVFEKRINARSTERYTVGILNGYIAVFYDEEVDGSRVKEQTEIPIDALSEDEMSRLTAGIRVIGEEQLLKVLEDYGS